MVYREPIATDEWYHCYNRGVDKRLVFMDEDDCERLLVLLYLCNDADSTTHVVDLELKHVRLDSVMNRRTIVRTAPLIDIGAYAFMPNHLHIIGRQLADGGLPSFMQKVFTGYTMYFNKKYQRTGSLFAGTYKSKHLSTDEYFKHAVQYVLLNPVELFEPGWKQGRGITSTIEGQLRGYRYSSVPDFFGSKRPENCIVHDIRSEYFGKKPTLPAMLKDAQLYYRENAKYLDR